MPKDLEYFQANPDELPADMAVIEQLLAGEQTEEAEEEPETAETEAPDQTEEDAPEPADAQGDDEEPAPILTKDGKRTIPYNVLATERERRHAAEQMQKELQARIEALEARAQNPSQAMEASDAVVATDTMSDAELAELVEDFPAIKKLIDYTKTLEGSIKQFESKFKQFETAEQARQQEQASRAANEVRAAVDSNPTLLYWEQHDPDRWQAAIEADNALQRIQANKNLTLAERFEKAVAMVETAYGPTELPDAYRKKTVAEKAPAVVEQARKPRTLSDIPGGAAPSTDPLEDFASMDAARLGATLNGMSAEQINALLARLG